METDKGIVQEDILVRAEIDSRCESRAAQNKTGLDPTPLGPTPLGPPPTISRLFMPYMYTALRLLCLL